MFCNQCEQTAKGIACTSIGVCGKQADTAQAQDMLVYVLRGLAITALQARKKGIINEETDILAVKALFSTLTNVNFDTSVLLAKADEVCAHRNALAQQAGITLDSSLTTFTPPQQIDGGAPLPISPDFLDENDDIRSLKQLLLYGLKGVAAYADHAAILGQTDPHLFTAFYEALAAGYDGQERDLHAWVNLVMDCGTMNITAMELLDKANTSAYGSPTPTEVPLGPVAGKAILITGHDLKDLYTLLKQTEGTGIQVYTHGEMLPAHGYPGLKAFPHLAGHYGTAWQNQQKEMATFPGAILFTTNCIQRPLPSYADNVFTTGLVGWPGIAHVNNGDFSAVIERAKALPGFTEEDVLHGNPAKVLTGFAHKAVLSVADTIIDAVKKGDIKHFFLVGGCDGAKPGRNYYTEFVEKTPQDTLVLTLACGKFRFFDKQLGSIGGIPRLLDIGQCNDAYSAVKIAMALAEAFECGINDLPLSLILSWYEQKAVAILLSLLSLGVKNIHLGPSLPAFVTPNILNFLVENFAIKPITTPDEDLKAILG